MSTPKPSGTMVALLALSGCGCLLVVTAYTPPVVTTPSGRLVGRYVTTRGGRSIMAFLGIPFAKPPVGPLRFQPPQPVDPWPYDRLAVVQPRACVQINDPTSSEDCLYLNVYTPEKDASPLLPVMVYFFGGGFEFGSIASYTPEFLLDEDILLVTVQYRLGLLGFLSTGDTVVPGNMGLKDLRQALRWVRDNIRHFGGDPDQVTVAGQSSGAVSAHYLMLFTAHEGLFRAAISHSAVALCPWGFHPPVEIRKMVATLSVLSGCPTDTQGLVDCFMEMPAQELALLYSVKYKTAMYFDYEALVNEAVPLIGGVLEPDCVQDRLVTANPWDVNNTVPWLVLLNSKESLFAFLAEETDPTSVGFLTINTLYEPLFPFALNYVNSEADSGVVAKDARKFYLQDQPISKLTLRQFMNLATDGLFIYPTYEAILRTTNHNVYLTLLDHVGPIEMAPVPPGSRIGTSHGDELFYFFPNPSILFPYREGMSYNSLQPEEEELSKKMVKLWTNFVTCLNPTPMKTCEIQWKPFFPKHSYLHIKQYSIESEDHFLQERMVFWQSHEFPFRDDIIDTPSCTNETHLNINTYLEEFRFD